MEWVEEKEKSGFFDLFQSYKRRNPPSEISPSSKLSRRGPRADLNEAITTIKIVEPFLQLVAVLRSVS